jgi:hypothetical protein
MYLTSEVWLPQDCMQSPVYLTSEVWLPQDFMQSPLFITFPPDMEKFLILKGKNIRKRQNVTVI